MVRDIGTPGSDPGQPTSKAEFARQVADRSLKELSEQLAAGNSVHLEAFLKAASRFHRYSFGNILLIMCQRPDATRVAGFHTWKSLGRSVRKGEKGIAIFAPMMIRPREEQDAPESDGDASAPKQLRFRVVHVFDVSQTEGEPLPEPARVGGNPGEALLRIESAVRESGIALETADSLGGADGVSSGGKIEIRAGLKPAERFAVIVHEWAHELLHKGAERAELTRTVRETEAEAVAFIVSQAIGLEAGTAAADYIKLYRGNPETLAGSLDRIQHAACTIIESIQTEPATTTVPHRTSVGVAAYGRQR